MNDGTVSAFTCLSSPASQPTLVFHTALDRPGFFIHACAADIMKFWQEQSSSFNNQNITVVIEDVANINQECPENLRSFQLAVSLAPLSLDNLGIRYYNLYATGELQSFQETLHTSGVHDCLEKYKAAAEYHNQHHADEAGIFVYIPNSDEEEIFIHEEAKKYAYPIPQRFSKDMPLNEVIGQLSGSTIFERNRVPYFLSFLQTKLMKIVRQSKKQIKSSLYLTNVSDSCASIISFRPYRQLIEDKKTFMLDIFIPQPVTGTDIICDDSGRSTPEWYLRMEREYPNNDVIYFNQRARILQQRIQSKIQMLEQLSYIMNDYLYQPYPHISLYENIDNPDSLDKNGENMLMVEYDDKRLLAAITPHKLYVSEVDNEESLALIKKMKTIFNNFDRTPYQAASSGDSSLSKMILYGTPAVGKSSLIHIFAQKYNKKVISSDLLINDFIFADSDSELLELVNNFEPGNEYENHLKQEIKKKYESARYTRRGFESYKNQGEKEHRTEEMYTIRDIASEIAIRQAFVTGDFADLGGKEICSDRTKFLIKRLGFIAVLLMPSLSDEEKQGKSEKEVQDEEYEAYYQMYCNDHSLIDEIERRNVFDYMVDASCFIYKDEIRRKIQDNEKIPEECRQCRWDDNERTSYKTHCPYKVLPEEKWRRFHDRLKADLFDKRYRFYRYKADITIDRRLGIGKKPEEFAKYIEERVKKFVEERDKGVENQ
jgi:GTPase SAR1 family protein